ncbi:MAG: glycosyltransferase family 2 protein [Campylobacteraceae bacterium]
MQSCSELSIVIPTYNRCEFIDYSLNIHIPIISKYKIQIFISDNASTDDTEKIVTKWMKKYDLLYYSKNKENLGADKNFELALKMPSSEYIWIIGDSKFFNYDCMENILSIIKSQKQVDAIIINDENRAKTKSQHFNDPNTLLSELGWHMSQVSSLIYNKKLIEKANFCRYHNTNFIQLCIIFEYLATKQNIDVIWCKDINVYSTKNEKLIKRTWHHLTFSIWADHWINAIMSLPPIYTLNNKLIAIKKHNDQTFVFTLKWLLYLRANGNYDYKTYKKYKNNILLSTTNNSVVKYLIPLLFPKKFLYYILNIVLRIKNYKSDLKTVKALQNFFKFQKKIN